LIPFPDLKARYHQIEPEVDAAVLRAIDSTQFVLGPEVAAFEKRFATYCNVGHCYAVNSGTSALHLALLPIYAQMKEDELAQVAGALRIEVNQ
jgi:dTDP-4-amino-4,6-dideoxygalactose transaminase